MLLLEPRVTALGLSPPSNCRARRPSHASLHWKMDISCKKRTQQNRSRGKWIKRMFVQLRSILRLCLRDRHVVTQRSELLPLQHQGVKMTQSKENRPEKCVLVVFDSAKGCWINEEQKNTCIIGAIYSTVPLRLLLWILVSDLILLSRSSNSSLLKRANDLLNRSKMKQARQRVCRTRTRRLSISSGWPKDLVVARWSVWWNAPTNQLGFLASTKNRSLRWFRCAHWAWHDGSADKKSRK